ncbi:amidase [Myriangium duriaei CBS 260.36]|uniref:Amidase n=1 Tax=Myriangium duriaei CBS 260.36 TaxID=1168546 RepID=A0A9P4J3T6_9PEZI|nr:amidase [Myriangium duriaei CBS 260.36]
MSGPLTWTACDCAMLLQSNHITSTELVWQYLDHFKKHNKAGLDLRAIITVGGRAVLKQADELDQERRDGRIRGPLHGIPIILKDCIQTSAELNMATTAGAAVFRSSIAREDAEVVRRLREQGLIVFGKASLTEFCGAKAKNTTAGWNAVNGQTQSAWIHGGKKKDDIWYGRSTPGGSSSGSAVGVAAGFAPLSVATETGGSCCMPANRSGLYSLKLSHEPELLEGVLPLCLDHDGLGGMGRSAEDVELLVQAMAGSRKITARTLEWKDLRIGFVDPTKFDAVPTEEDRRDESHLQILKDYDDAIEKIRQHGAKIVYPAALSTMEELSYKDQSVLHIISYLDTVKEWPKWIAKMNNTPVKTLKDIVDWNEANAKYAMPEPHTNQSDLYDALNSKYTQGEVKKMQAEYHAKAREAIEDCLSSNDIDIIIGPGDCSICVVASLARCPSAMVPMTILTGEKGMGQPQGLMIISKRHDEGKMLEFMKLWNKHIGPWQIPTRFREDPPAPTPAPVSDQVSDQTAELS